MDFPMMSLDELIELEVSGWNPEPGAKLVGLVIDRRDGIEGGYDPYTMLVIQTGEQEATAVHCFHSALRSEVERQDPQVGDQIAVKYLGQKPTKGQSRFASYEAYNLIVRTPAGTSKRKAAPWVPERFTPSGQSEHERRVAEHNEMVERTRQQAQGEVQDVDQADIPFEQS